MFGLPPACTSHHDVISCGEADKKVIAVAAAAAILKYKASPN